MAIAAPIEERPLFRKQLYNFQRLAATKSREAENSRTELDAQISTLVTYWAAASDGQIRESRLEIMRERSKAIVELPISERASAHRTKRHGVACDFAPSRLEAGG
jgi:hypothetical protein